jgi:hypothetical protein
MASQEGASTSTKSPLTVSKAVNPISTPTYATGGSWTILTTTTINAPASAVFEASVDSSLWPEWNSFTPRTTPRLRLEPGVKLTFYNKMKASGPADAASEHEVIEVKKITKDGREGYSIVWKTIGIPCGDWLLRAERVQEIMDLEGEKTDYRTWGTFGGPVAIGLAWAGIKDQVVERFEDWANDLKEFVEKDVPK